ncbi:hypothetical protein ACMA1I_17630 [Pontibacter sp. 13R65]|uniref:hypothetical protein n=1 Tax=Pontibacter sp. 13R65 TaxID=3127458 RepID=UPI00301C6CC7
MDKISRIISIPKPLWKLHGRKAYLIDLLLTYFMAVLVAVVNVVLSASMPAWQVVLLVVLSLDIGGGAVSNFTSGTIEFYKKSDLSPYTFIWLHLLQAGLLLCIYWSVKSQIILLAFLILVLSSLVIRVREVSYKRQLSIFLFAVFVLIMFSLSDLPKPPCILLVLMGLKLIVGFSGHWKGSRKQG